MARRNWDREAAQKKLRRAAKHRELTKLIDAIDVVTERAVDNDAYHANEMDHLNRARSALFAVRSGYIRRGR